MGCGFLVVRAKWMLFYILVFLFSATAMFFMATAFHTVATQAENKENVAAAAPVIILDAGHGGEDGGAVSTDGTMEKDINLDITLRLRDLFAASGCKVILTRAQDTAIYDDGASTLKEKKISDMKNRLELFNSLENGIVLSIHQNQFSQTQYSGTQVFYSPNTQESADLAESIRASVTGMLQPQNTRENKKATKDIYLLYHTQTPAVIVECGFLSNEKELDLLQSAEYRQQMAFAIYCGCLDYFQKH